MVAEVFSGISSLKAAFDIAKGLKEIDDTNRRNVEISNLVEKLLASRQQQSALLDRISELEKENARLKDSVADRQNYVLVQIGNGCSAYIRKPTAEDAEQSSWLCATCFEGGKKSHLQFQTDFGRLSVFHCPSCASKLSVPKGVRPSAT